MSGLLRRYRERERERQVSKGVTQRECEREEERHTEREPLCVCVWVSDIEIFEDDQSKECKNKRKAQKIEIEM